MVINTFITTINKSTLANKQNKYIVIHNTGNDGDTAKGNCNYFSTQYRNASAHYFVDTNSIWQCVEDDKVAWHCGGAKKYYSNCRNSNSIGVEMCSKRNKSTGEYYIEESTINNTKKLVALLMVKYNITTDFLLRHYDVTRKECPQSFVRYPNLWDSFVSNLKWVNDVIYLKMNNRLNSAEKWVLKAFEQDSQLKFLFPKWADDARKANSLTN